MFGHLGPKLYCLAILVELCSPFMSPLSTPAPHLGNSCSRHLHTFEQECILQDNSMLHITTLERPESTVSIVHMLAFCGHSFVFYMSICSVTSCILYVHLLCDKENQSLVENLNRDGFWKLEGQSLVVYWSD